jgi:hypothetical protein
MRIPLHSGIPALAVPAKDIAKTSAASARQALVRSKSDMSPPSVLALQLARGVPLGIRAIRVTSFAAL